MAINNILTSNISNRQNVLSGFQNSNASNAVIARNDLDVWDASSDRKDYSNFRLDQQNVRAFLNQNFGASKEQQKTDSSETTKTEASGKKVTVQPGDSISSLLLKAGFPREKAFDPKFHDEIAKQNNLKNKNLIYPGQVLNLPSPSDSDKSEVKDPNQQDPSTKGNEKSPTPNKPVSKKPTAPVKKKKISAPSKTQVVKKVQSTPALSTSEAIAKAKAHLEEQKIQGRQFLVYTATPDSKDKGKVYVKATMPNNITPGNYAINMTVTSKSVVTTSYGFGK